MLNGLSERRYQEQEGDIPISALLPVRASLKSLSRDFARSKLANVAGSELGRGGGGRKSDEGKEGSEQHGEEVGES